MGHTYGGHYVCMPRGTLIDKVGDSYREQTWDTLIGDTHGDNITGFAPRHTYRPGGGHLWGTLIGITHRGQVHRAFLVAHSSTRWWSAWAGSQRSMLA
jgi:hypothetical protein